MTEGAPWKHILRFALPVVAGSLLQQLYNTVDTIVVGNFSGEASLSAVGTTNSFIFLFMAIAIGLSSGNGVVIAQHYGAGRETKMRECASTGILLLLAAGLVCTVVSILVSRPAYKGLVNVPPEILEETLLYFRIYALGLVFQFGYNIFASVLRAVGDSRATLYFLMTASVINIILDVIFVGGFRWGVAGAAAATDISQALSFIAAYIYMRRRYPIFRFSLREYTWRAEHAVRTVKVGTPIAAQLMIVSFGLTFIQRAVNGFGRTMTASFTVGQRMDTYLHLPCNAFQTTLATYTGQNIGAGKPERIKPGVRQTVLVSFLFTLAIAICVWVFDAKIIGLFGLSEEAAAYCFRHLRAIALVTLILSVYVPVFGVFQGANHSAIPTLVATFALTTRAATTYIFRYSPFFGYSIIWWNGLFGYGLGCTITWIYYLSKRWLKNSRIAG